MKVDLTVLAIPAYAAAIAAEVAWQRAHPVEPGTRAGDYQTADTLASLVDGRRQPGRAVPVARRVLDPVTPGRGRYGRALLAAGAAAAVLTTVGRRRPPPGARGPAAGPADRPGRGPRGAGGAGRAAPGAGRPARRARPHARSLERLHGGLAVAAVAGTAMTVSTVWAARTSADAFFRRSPLDLGGSQAGLGRRRSSAGTSSTTGTTGSATSRRWLWAVHVAHHSSERYNLSTALRQPVAESITIAIPYSLLAPARRPPGADRAGPRAQPDLPVLDPHRGDPQHRVARAGAQHPVAPPGPPRLQPALPRPQPRQHPDRLGPAVRHLRAGDRARSSTA